MSELETLEHKKFLKVPILYWIGGGVVIFGIVAWRLKDTVKSSNSKDTATDASTTADSVPADGTDTDYSGFGATSGTFGNGDGSIVTSPVDTTSPTGNASITTNDEWIAQGVAYLVSEGDTGGAAQLALTLYVQGGDLSFDQGKMRDDVIKKYGIPPEALSTIGSTGSAPTTPSPVVPKPATPVTAPAKRQFGAFPGIHTIKGSNDNTFTKLAQLYYGSTANDRIDLLQGANLKLGHSGPFPTGTRVNIPLYRQPKYVTATSTMRTAAEIASKNGLSQGQLTEYNDGMKFPVSVGTKVRVF